MPAPVFYVPSATAQDDRVILPDSERHHATAVLRLSDGAEAIAVNGAGAAFFGFLHFSAGTVSFKLRQVVQNWGEPTIDLILAAGFSTGSKFDQTIQMGTEIGVSSFMPLLSEKTKLKERAGDMHGRLERWERLAVSAIKQARRSRLPALSLPRTVEQFLSEIHTSAEKRSLIVFHQTGDPLQTVAARIGCQEKVAVLTGPESGFTGEEIAMVRLAGAHLVSLGSRTLRAETAAPVAAALVLHELSQVNNSR